MPKKILIIFLILATTMTAPSRLEAQEIDPRVKALGLMALYGTVGGTLLGAASLAFGTGGRSVVKGASLGLYAGILFGSFVVIGHVVKKHNASNPEAESGYYPETKGRYESDEGESGGGGWFDFGDDGSEETDAAERFRLYDEISHSSLGRADYMRTSPHKFKRDVRILVPILFYQF